MIKEDIDLAVRGKCDMSDNPMNPSICFDRLGNMAEQQGCLLATPDGLDALDKWLESQGRGRWSRNAREYMAERIHLLGDRHADEPFAVRLTEYLNAYGTRLIRKSTTASKDKKAHLDRLIASIEKASQA